MFQLCSCHVAIGGDIRSVVPRKAVTPAEIMLLQGIHGSDAVTNIRVIGEQEGSMDSERDRLGRFYGDAKVVAQFNQFGDLPTTLEAARIGQELLDPAWKPEPKAPVKKAAPRKRARTEKGHFVKDDPSTPENEAYVEE